MAAVITSDWANSSGHYYTRDGSPAYTVIGKNGKERATTIRDARELGLVPSVTTILKLAAAPNLVNWFKEQVARAAFAERPREGEPEADYIARVLPLAEEVSAKARDRGTEIHSAVERLYRDGKIAADEPYFEHCGEAAKAVSDWAGEQDWSAERSFASPLGYGGKLDLSAPGYVADFKTTDKPLDGLKLWPEHRRQLAAYRHGLNMPAARCAIVYVSAVTPAARVIELGEEELQQGWEEFKSLLAFYYAANKMRLPDASA